MIQVLIILFFGIYTTALTEPGNLTGSLIILLGILLSYQYGFFSLNFKVKLLTLLIFYVSATLINSLFINRMQLPTGIPSIIFTITAVYLFWTVFQEDIKRYLYQTNQLQDKLVQVEADKKYLNSLASDRLSQIEQQNRILEQRLYEKTELEEQLRHNLAEKEVLLREVNHRVKNNLSIILSMLNLQKGEITNTELKTFIAENQNRIQTLGAEISRDYQDKEPILVSILRGSFLFLADLTRALTVPHEVDFMAVSSYGNAQESTGVVRLLQDLSSDVSGRHVLVVEDIVDTGLTWEYIRANLLTRRPASLKIVTLLNKEERRRVEVPVDYAGFVIDDAFVVGYGLDYQQKLRNLPYIGVLQE